MKADFDGKFGGGGGVMGGGGKGKVVSDICIRRAYFPAHSSGRGNSDQTGVLALIQHGDKVISGGRDNQLKIWTYVGTRWESTSINTSVPVLSLESNVS